MSSALGSIAAIPLWGERINDPALKVELAKRGEYENDGDEEQFTPSGDTESSHLRDAVETAREALAALQRAS